MRFALLTLFAALVLSACSDDSATSPDDSELQIPAVGSVFNLIGWRFKENSSTFDSLPGTTAASVMTIAEKNISYEGKSGVWKTIITDVRTGRVTDTLYMCYDASKDLLLLDPRCGPDGLHVRDVDGGGAEGGLLEEVHGRGHVGRLRGHRVHVQELDEHDEKCKGRPTGAMGVAAGGDVEKLPCFRRVHASYLVMGTGS
jgi:hypothetical protein